MKKVFLLLGDIVSLYLALYLTLIIRYRVGFEMHLYDHVYPFSIIFIFWIIVFYIGNIYDLDTTKNNVYFYRLLSYLIISNAIITLSAFYLVPFLGITPKTNFLIFLGLIIILLGFWRWIYNIFLIQSGANNNTLIIGANKQSSDLYDFLLANPQLGYNALGMLDVANQKAIEILPKLIREKKVKTLVLSPETYKIPNSINKLYSLLDLKINFRGLSDFYEDVSGKVPLETIDQSWFLDNLSEHKKRFYDMASRIFDISASIIVGIFSLPLYPFIVVAVKRTNGPIFIRQTRIGKAGKTFVLVKFRSMITNAPDGSAEGETGAVWTQKNDPRITRVGDFLRKTRLDELPQLYNVLKGEMSFIGPRSERPEFHKQLKEKIPFYEERYLVKPGLTGWTQIKYPYGSTVEDAHEKLKYDLYYIKNRSILLDLGIFLKTINIIFKKAGR